MGDGGRALLLGAASVLAAFGLYGGALGHPFLGDDQLAVSGNPTVAQPSVTGLRTLWVTDYWRGITPDGQVTEMSTDRNLYRPVTVASFWLTSWLAGVDPMAFRVGNVLLHALAATLIGLLCVAMGWRRGALVAVAFVLVHPVATDVVNRIVGRADVLAVVGVAAWLVVQRRAQQWGWTGLRALGAFVAACVALGAKESGVVLVPLALLQGWLSSVRGGGRAGPAGDGRRDRGRPVGDRRGDRRRLAGNGRGRRGRPAADGRGDRGGQPGGVGRGDRGGQPGGVGRGDRGQWLVGAAVLGMAVVLYLLGRGLAVDLPTYAAASTWDLGGNPVWEKGLDVRLPVAAALALYYARLVLWPTPLLAFDVPPVLPTWGDAETWLGVVLVVALVAALIAAARRRHPVSVGIAWWLVSLLIVSQLLVPIGAYREVRFAYAMVAAAALVVGWLAERLAVRAGAVRAAAANAGAVDAGVADVAGAGAASAGDARAVGARAGRAVDARVVGGRVAWAVGAVVVLGALALAATAVLRRNADFRDLRTLLEADVRQRPASPAALIRLANIHDQAGRDDEAERAFARVLELAPTSAQARYELADFHARRGRADRARALHERAIALNPSHHLSLMALGTMALGERDLEQAEALLARAAAVAPDDPFVIYNLAVLEDARGERARALARLTALVERRPDFLLAVRGLEKLRADGARKGRR